MKSKPLAVRAMRVTDVARVIYGMNREYCATLGDYTHPAWEMSTGSQAAPIIDGIAFYLEKLRHGETPSPAALHEHWLAVKQADGWTYGPVKNVETKEHPCMLPYRDLPLAQQLKDYLFGAIVKAYYESGIQIEDDTRDDSDIF